MCVNDVCARVSGPAAFGQARQKHLTVITAVQLLQVGSASSLSLSVILKFPDPSCFAVSKLISHSHTLVQYRDSFHREIGESTLIASLALLWVIPRHH